ncbi:hypothetical protein [Peptoniphilus raoultii]|uniref:hypothetical protein n=1 Tax=Peptoniphilus raoultii TaxID=1776387 RepID=UPI0008DA0B16|nr:hypothetical protein [Peptoniphilus raoultii]
MTKKLKIISIVLGIILYFAIIIDSFHFVNLYYKILGIDKRIVEHLEITDYGNHASGTYYLEVESTK